MRTLLQLVLLRIAVAAWSLGNRLGRRRPGPGVAGTFELAAARVIGETAERGEDETAAAEGRQLPAPSGYRPVRARGQLNAALGAALLLVDEQAQLFVPIFVGPGESLAFQHRLAGSSFRRPLPYDLFDRLLAEVGGEIRCARVDALRDDVFAATVELELPGDRHLELDARASDAVILALGAGAPIFASDAIMKGVGRPLPVP